MLNRLGKEEREMQSWSRIPLLGLRLDRLLRKEHAFCISNDKDSLLLA
jgi:hypothetical protein